MRSLLSTSIFIVLLTACADHAPAPVPPTAQPANEQPAPRARVELAIAKDGIALGRIQIIDEESATLELVGNDSAAAELKEHFDNAIAKGWFGVDVHESTPEGGRGALSTRMYRPRDRDYALGVELWLRYEENLEVTRIAP